MLTRVVAARPERVWYLALLPMGALVAGRRSRRALVAVGVELAALWLAHAFVTLVRAARLEGG